MSDTYTNTTEDSDAVLSADHLMRVWKELQAKFPPLLYHTSKYMPALDEDGKPFVVQIKPTDAFPGLTDSFDEYVVLHPDNLPHLKRWCAGRYRLEPLVKE